MKDNRTFDVYKKLKHFCSAKVFKPLPFIKLDNNFLITDPDEQIALWLDHYMKIFDSKRPSLFPSSSHNIEPPDANFTVAEITKAINRLRNNESPGHDNILGEHLKAAPSEVSQLLLGLFNKIWHTGKMTGDWNLTIFYNFPKIPNPTKFKDYRAIALTSIVLKVFMILLKNRILAFSPNLLSKYICAYCPNRNINEPILALNIIVQKCEKYKLPFYFIFIDFKRASGSITHDTLWAILVRCGIEANFIKILEMHYNNLMASFKFLNKVSPPFRTKKGANLLELGSNQPWFLENRAISYADDLVLIAKNLEEANNLVLILNTFSLKVGLDINFDKTVIMPSSHALPLGVWLVGGKVVKVVSSYKYLGVNIDNKGSYKDELRFRIQNARAAFYKYSMEN
ncbi:uncharacterized protein LOC135926815 [Gordionus sp. m RMFG-2023]|uniref:uncharacterized protein LOC135926815 n=1 Tax=Gordionus sp. m RMFG-2023 TaxID=3053472 RepID=UPI0031FDE0E2